MNDIINATAHVPTLEQQERIAAASRAMMAVADKRGIDEETARLIALPLDQTNNPEAIVRAAVATRIRASHFWMAAAKGVALDADGNEVK